MKQIVVVVLMVLNINMHAQNLAVSAGTEQHPGPLALNVGDKLPDLPLAKVLMNGKLTDFTTRDYKDKLLIIDFWDTHCSSCIEAFPRLDELQKTFGNQLQIITVTWQKEAEIRKFKENNKLAKSFTLPIMVEDTLLKAHFPYRFVSHTVWINKGQIIAISNSEYIDKRIVSKALNGEQLHLPVKNDFASYDFKKGSLLGAAEPTDKKIYSVISGYKVGVTANGSENASIVDSVNGIIKDIYLNRSIARLYITLLLNIKPIFYVLKPSMIQIEARHPEHYESNYKPEGTFMEDWVRQNSICYESVLPATLDNKERARRMLSDLDNKLGLHGRMELRPHKVLVVKATTGTTPLADETKDGKSLGKQDFKQFMMGLTYNTFVGPDYSNLPPIVDESNTKADRLIDVYTYKDLASIKRVLNLNGLDITEETRPIEVFVLTETGNSLLKPTTSTRQ